MAANSDGLKIAEQRIAREAEERTGTLDLDWLGLEEIPRAVAGLTHLRELRVGIPEPGGDRDVEPPFNARINTVADLRPLANLAGLQSLSFLGSSVTDLTPIAHLTNLQSIDCSNTPVADLAPIAGLKALRSLNCTATKVNDLSPISQLTALQRLSCTATEVADLAPISRLTALQTLRCVSSQVVDLAPIERLTALQSLLCRNTRVADLAPLGGLTALQNLDCSQTRVADLAPLLGLPSLREIDASNLVLKSFDERWADRGRLDKLVLYGTRLPKIPSGVLSSTSNQDCLPSLRAYLEDSNSDDARLEDVKLMLLGNGRVGKTQLARALQGEPFQPDSRSTHGVTIAKYDLPRANDPPIPLHIWDFGGQDIYHGTHALFLRDHAIFALVWAREFETPSPDRPYALLGDRPLRYWVDYVRRSSGVDRAVVVVQTRSDKPRDATVCPVPEAELREAFGEFHTIEFSARTPRGLDALREALGEAAAFALEQEGAPKIPAAWARVKAGLEAMRAEDQAHSESERRYRVVEAKAFAALCREQGVKSEPKHLLNYLHRSGVVFYREDLMNRIVLDQAWALEAIYAVFEREGGAYERIRANRGRFTLADLTTTAWRERGEDERALFLDMMRACGVCFRLDRREKENETTRYIAPELLPERADVEADILRDWDTGQPIYERTYRYKFLHDGLIRALIAGIGDFAGPEAVYWRDGVTVYETTSRARARIEQMSKADASGVVTVQTRGGDAENLLSRLCLRVGEIQQRLGLEGESDTPAPPAPSGPEPMEFGRDPADHVRLYVSYAWADDDDPTREESVDAICAEAAKRGLKIIRDKDAMKRGDDIADFMQALGKADLVYVFLSDKYLRSPFCMFELFEIWRNSRQDKSEFKRRARLFALPDAKIRTLREQTAYAIHWDDELKKLQADLQGRDPIRLLGESGAKAYRHMHAFKDHVVDILALFAGTLQARTFDEFLASGFEDLAK